MRKFLVACVMILAFSLLMTCAAHAQDVDTTKTGKTFAERMSYATFVGWSFTASPAEDYSGFQKGLAVLTEITEHVQAGVSYTSTDFDASGQPDAGLNAYNFFTVITHELGSGFLIGAKLDLSVQEFNKQSAEFAPEIAPLVAYGNDVVKAGFLLKVTNIPAMPKTYAVTPLFAFEVAPF